MVIKVLLAGVAMLAATSSAQAAIVRYDLSGRVTGGFLGSSIGSVSGTLAVDTSKLVDGPLGADAFPVFDVTVTSASFGGDVFDTAWATSDPSGFFNSSLHYQSARTGGWVSASLPNYADFSAFQLEGSPEWMGAAGPLTLSGTLLRASYCATNTSFSFNGIPSLDCTVGATAWSNATGTIAATRVPAAVPLPAGGVLLLGGLGALGGLGLMRRRRKAG